MLHSLKADKALSIYSSYLHLLVLYEMIQNPIFLQYSANRPYKEKLDRKLPVDRGPVSPTDALSFHRPGRNNDRRQKAPSPGEASPLLRHAFKRLPSPCIPRHPAGGCSGPGTSQPGGSRLPPFPVNPKLTRTRALGHPAILRTCQHLQLRMQCGTGAN